MLVAYEGFELTAGLEPIVQPPHLSPMEIDPQEAKALSDIEEHVCHIIHVIEDDESAIFTCFLGIERTSKQLELIVTGPKQDSGRWIVNKYEN